MPAGSDSSIASERLCDRDVTARLRSLKLNVGRRSANGLARLVSVPGRREHPWQGQRGLFKGTRTPVATVFENLEDGMTIDEVMEQFSVTREQVKAVLEFAARSLDAPMSGR